MIFFVFFWRKNTNFFEYLPKIFCAGARRWQLQGEPGPVYHPMMLPFWNRREANDLAKAAMIPSDRLTEPGRRGPRRRGDPIPAGGRVGAVRGTAPIRHSRVQVPSNLQGPRADPNPVQTAAARTPLPAAEDGDLRVEQQKRPPFQPPLDDGLRPGLYLPRFQKVDAFLAVPRMREVRLTLQTIHQLGDPEGVLTARTVDS